MKINILSKRRDKIEVIPESEEDLWTLKTVLRPGDEVTAKTVREVSFRGRGEKERKPIIVTIKIKNIEFQPFTGKLRLFGVIIEGPEEYGIKGKHQSIMVTPGKRIIVRREGGFQDAAIKRLETSGPKGRAVIVAIDYDEYAVAVLSPHGFKIIVDKDIPLPGKDDPSREQRIRQVIDEVSKVALEAAKQYNASLIIVAGPGPLKEEVAKKLKQLTQHHKILTDNVSMGGRAGIEEVLRRQTLAQALRDYSAALAEQVLAQAMRIAATEPGRVAFGLEEAFRASELGAVERLVILEDLVFSINDKERELANSLLENVEKYRGEIIFVSRDSPIGEKLVSMGGAIAILRFPIVEEQSE